RRYLDKRGVNSDVVRTQRVGYADGRSLQRVLERFDAANLTSPTASQLAVELGLVVSRSGNDTEHSLTREFFFDRIMIPALRGGRPIWFIGRAIEEPTTRAADESGTSARRPRPKYLSLPGERPVLGQERVLGRSTAYLVEGPVDWLAAVAWDLP